MQIKLITYNIWQGKYLDKVIAFLKDESAGIICLQEAAEEGKDFGPSQRNLYKEIGGALEMKGEYRRMCWGEVGKGEFDIGIAIYSNFKVLDQVEFRYEREQVDEALAVAVNGQDRYAIPRVLLGLKLMMGKEPLWIFTAHHTITPDGGVTEHQLQNTRRVKEFLAGYDRYILCGDMNTPYGNRNYELLSEGLNDLSNPTKPTLHPTMHKVGHKGYHVDYVFAKGQGIKHLFTRVPVVDASDHLPVVVTLSVT